jgi:hypothetical protein
MFRRFNLISATFALITILLMCAFANAQPQSKPKPTPTPTPRPDILVSIDKNNLNFGVVIALGLPKPEAFTYNPTTGEIKPQSGEIQAGASIPGIGVVLKHNPGGGAITIPVSDGKGNLPSDAENGNYDMLITIPQSSLPGQPPASKRKGVTITFALMKTPEGWVHKKGTGSPKAADSR